MLLRIKIFNVKEGKYPYGIRENMEEPFGVEFESEGVLLALPTERA